MTGTTQMGASSDAASRATKIRRRGFIGAGAAAVGAAIVAPSSLAAAPRVSAPPLDLHPPIVNPTTQTLVAIPDRRVATAVGYLGEIVEAVMASSGVPGVAAAVVQGEELLYAKGFGVRDIRTGAPVDAGTVFHLASVSKSLSATVLAGIVDREIVEWSDPIAAHLANFALADPYVTQHVTYGDMFSHRSGLPDHAGDLLEDLGYSRNYILRALRHEPLRPFRAAYEYTNFGLTAAAVAAANAARADWATIADLILFRPLGMVSTSYRYSDFLREPNRAAMHVRIDDRWFQKFRRNADPEAPAGGASSSVVDLAKWMMLRLADGKFGGRQRISADALLRLDTPQSVAGPPSMPASRAGFYGYGTNVSYDYSGRARMGHSGAFNQGASTAYSFLPDQRLGIIALTNGMPIGVPESIAAYFMDLVIDGAITNDWSELYREVTAASYVNHSALSGVPRPKNPIAAQPTAFYVGTYANDYYGPVRVVARGSKLHVLMGPGPTDYPLTHWDADEFALYPIGENAVGISLAAFTSSRGTSRASELVLEYYNTTGLGAFVRN